jgi:signal transduction histidine kinase
LGNYLFQIANKLCEKSESRCRFFADDLPREIVISSQIRHNICMAVKEALHNVIKHAKASEVAIRITFENSLLTISVEDNGCGFDTSQRISGAGLMNLRQRMKDIGGTCVIESTLGKGTTVCLRVEIPVQND